MSDIATRVKKIIVDKLGVDEAEVTPEASFTNDLGADSLDTVELIMEFEKEFNVAIPDELKLAFNGGEEPFYFSRYYYLDLQTDNEYYILANKGSEGFLIPEMKTVDYFLLIYNFIDEDDIQSVISGLNRINEVLVAAEVDPKKLKSKENLVF